MIKQLNSADTPILYAYSCQNLKFAENLIFKSNSAERWHKSDSPITLSYCVDSIIENNKWVGEFGQDKVLIEEV